MKKGSIYLLIISVCLTFVSCQQKIQLKENQSLANSIQESTSSNNEEINKIDMSELLDYTDKMQESAIKIKNGFEIFSDSVSNQNIELGKSAVTDLNKALTIYEEILPPEHLVNEHDNFKSVYNKLQETIELMEDILSDDLYDPNDVETAIDVNSNIELIGEMLGIGFEVLGNKISSLE